jgi:hypothetical protein
MDSLPCRIVLQGDLSDHLDPAFAGLSVRRERGYTQLSGSLADRAQLWSLLDRLFALGLEVVTVETGDRVTSPGPRTDA